MLQKYYHQNIVKVPKVKVVIVQIGPLSVLKAGKGAASLNDFVYCRVACGFTPGGTNV